MRSPFDLPPGPEHRAAMAAYPLRYNLSPNDFTDEENAEIRAQADELLAAIGSWLTEES